MTNQTQTDTKFDDARLFINDEWGASASDERISIENPATEAIIGSTAAGNATDAQHALEAAQAAQPAWAALAGVERAQALRQIASKIMQHQDRLADILVAEQGKPRSLAMGEVAVSADFINFAAEAGRRTEGDIYSSDNRDEHIWIHKVPYGVVVAVAAWNFPLALAARKIGPALIAGNTVVLKPSEYTPLATLELARLIEETDLPPGVVNVVTGWGADIGDALVANPITSLVTMTGSVRGGSQIMKRASERILPVRLELGGKAPFIVMEDADLDKAVNAAVASRFCNAGQVCTCVERVYVHEDVYDAFVERLLTAVAKVTVGDPKDEVDYGPQIRRQELKKIEALVNEAVTNGATLQCGGKRPSGPAFEKGHWYEPTVLTDVNHDMRIMRNEVFGPVIPVMKIHDFDEALALANDSDYGLSAYLFTDNMRRVMRATGELQFGEIYVNRAMGEQRQGFHNGHKMSGLGGEDGKYGQENYLQKKTFYVNFS